MATTKEVVKKEEAGLPAAFDYGDDAGSGFEHQSSQDFSIPFLSVLQALSPQLKDPDEGGIEGARPGYILNTVTGEVFSGKEGVEFVPATTQHVYVEWVPRDSGGGFVGIHQVDSPVVSQALGGSREFGKLKSAAGNDLIETFYVYGVLCENGEPQGMAVIAFTSTKIKVYKRFSTKVNMFTIKTPRGKQRPPLFAHAVRIKTASEKNNKGDFYNFVLEPVNGDLASSLLAPDDPRFQAGKQCYEMVEGGSAQANYAKQDGGSGASDEEIPF